MVYKIVKYLDEKIMNRYEYFIVDENERIRSPIFDSKPELLEWWEGVQMKAKSRCNSVVE